jgi:predicted nuclease with RNAse H fold
LEDSVSTGTARERRFVGVDLATEARRTGVVVLDVTPTVARATVPPVGFVADDAGLVSVVDAGTVVGLDAPLGWPDDFVRAVDAHHRGEAWPTFGARADKVRERLRCRETDLFVRDLGLGVTPLSVSSDRIGVVAMRGALLQSAWAVRWGRREDRDGSGRLVETYPAAALRAWGLLARRGERYKGGARTAERDEQRIARERIVSELARAGAPWLDLDVTLRDAAVASDHALDALVCALVALAAHARATHAIPEDRIDAARREGWIHVPYESLAVIGKRLGDVGDVDASAN